MGRLEGKVAVVTGGASGSLAADLARSLGPDAMPFPCNVVEESEVAAAIGAAVERWGGLDIVFNNAGFGGISGPLEATTVAEYDLTMNVLLRSVFLGIKHASPHLKARGGGSIVNTASVCAFEAGIGNQLYSVAKAAVVMMTKTAALELAEHNVRVNAVCPGYIATPLAAGRPISANSPERVASALARLRESNRDVQPIARSGEPEDIANMVLFLAGDESRWVTGQAMVVDGGLLAGQPWRKLEPWLTERREIRVYRPPQ